MKKFNLILGLGLIITWQAQAQNNDNLKRYEVSSAKVTYKITSPQGSGTKTLIFDQYGKRESLHEVETKNGKVTKDQLILINNGKMYSVNLLTKEGRNMSGAMQMAGMGDGDMLTKGKQMLQSMGGKQVGYENFLGKNCEKWEMNAMGKINFLFWKGVPMKSESNVMGIKSSEVATSIQTGVHFSDSDFALPKGVEIEKDEDMFGSGMEMSPEEKKDMKKLMNMSYSDFRKMMKKENPDMPEEQIKQAYDMMKKMGNMFQNK
ncbi:MAG: hypothetical protein JXR65_06650 [Bacteroidales bacterium]|nr:hypothetical protein [Bacteroidales bacterium]